LPVAVAAPQPRPEKPVFLTIQADKTLSIGERTITTGTLVSELDIATQTRRDTRLYVRADKDVPYGALMEVMNQLRTGGYLKVGLVGLESVGSAAANPVPGQ
jgi:biopolymer transport protein ExbD